MSKVGTVKISKNNSEISKELKSTYGSTVVLLTSNPEELDKIFDKLKNDYKIVLDNTVIDNGDYAKVIIRKDLNNASSDIHK